MITIRSLAGHSQIELACTCLGSLLENCNDPISFVIHDDGTLTPGDLAILSKKLRNPQFVMRADADRQVLPKLEKLPACTKYRNENVMGLKLFDICLLHTEDAPLYYCDSDILFLRPFKLPATIKKSSTVFMKDTQLALSLRPWHLKPFGPLNVLSHANAGFIIVWAPEIDFNYIESVLSNPKFATIFSRRPQWVEQTCWAAMATRLTPYLLDAEQVSLATADMGPVAPEQVAIHFVSTHRGKLGEYVKYRPADPTRVPELRLIKAPRASAFGLIWSEIAKKLG